MTQTAATDLGSVVREQFPAAVAAILQRFGEASAQLRDLLETAPLRDLIGSTDAVNVQGEITAKLDDAANSVFVEALRLPDVSWLVSEEETEPIHLGPGTYACCFDPLDGSSNIGVSGVGSVLGIYTGVTGFGDDTPITGRQLVAAAFTVYGLPTMLMVASPGNVDGYVFDPADRTWKLTTPGIATPKAKYTSINWMYRDTWSPQVTAAVDAASEGLRGRYSGSMVEDILRVLLSGGVFLYPEDSSSPSGKLRMLYEVCPISFILEAAGGASTNGSIPILDVPVTKPHQRSPLIVGDAAAVARYRGAHGG
ncbi:MAG: class 1 fructose-bisphosphatase [Dehalococcoidia bacterium]